MITDPRHGESVARTIKHLSLHRIGKTELRVVADMDAGVLPIIQIEEDVIREYAQRASWPHRWVSLFVLQDLGPLLHQRKLGTELTASQVAALEQRPVVNVYDLADLAGCHVFVNQQAMAREGYWNLVPATRGLLAHEHAHPLAENETSQASRRLLLDVSLPDRQGWTADVGERVCRLFAALATELGIDAPREVFANEIAIRSGFGEDLFYLDRINVARASRSVSGRQDLRRLLRQEMDQGRLSAAAAELLLLIGDMKSYLNLALETSAFYRGGQEGKARELESVLLESVFPSLEPQVFPAFAALRGQYVALQCDLSPSQLISWAQGVLNILGEAVAQQGQDLRVHLRTVA